MKPQINAVGKYSKMVICPYCGRKWRPFAQDANCSGVWVKCNQCGAEYEVKIVNGEQK